MSPARPSLRRPRETPAREDEDAAADRVAVAIERDGYAVQPGWLGAAHVSSLRARAAALDAAGQMQSAGVGRGGDHRADAAVRADRTGWLGDVPEDRAEVPLYAGLEVLRRALNRQLTLGLFSFEGHYAIYPPGGGYARHLDRFRDDDTRVLSCVLYLNDAWGVQDGGALRLHRPGASALDVLPQGGTLVTFLSACFEHEVLAARRERWSMAGWFRRRAV